MWRIVHIVTVAEVAQLMRETWEDGCRRCEKDLQNFVDPLNDWIDELLQRRLPSNWRDLLQDYLDEQVAKGYEVMNLPVLNNYILRRAEYFGLQPAAIERTRPFSLDETLQTVAASPISDSARDFGGSGILAAAPGPSGRLPRSGGEWKGTPGEGIWKPKKPISLANGIKIDQVPYRDGKPVFDKWSKGEIKIAITGEPGFDRAQAIRAWYAEGGGKLLDGYIFHHDGLTTETIKYKGKDVLVGRMQLVPFDLNGKIPHIGSASAARRFAGHNKELAKKLANEVNQLAIKGKGPLMKVAKRFSSVLRKGAKKVGRLLPLVGGVLVIIDFTENVEAHGVGGAIVRGTPLLGDLVTIYDVASDLAEEIKTNADEHLQAHIEEINRNVHRAHQAAAALTLQEFEDLAKRVRVTSGYFDAQSLKEPLEEFYHSVRPLIYLRLEGRRIAHPPRIESGAAEMESAFNMKLRMAREKLEREIRQRVEQPGHRVPRGPAA